MPAPLRFGLIGHGRFGKHYDRLLREFPDVELAATATRHTETRPEDVFKNPKIDAVIIATPASTHADLIKQAVSAGKHVLVEKPMVTSNAEARAIEPLLQKSNQIFMVGYQYIYNDYILALQKSLASLGTIRLYIGEHLAPGPAREDIGSFMDAGVHDLSILEFLFRPGEVTAAVGKRVVLDRSGRDDFTAASITYASGVSAHLTTSWAAPEKIRRVTIIGEQGSAVFNDRLETDKLRIYRHGAAEPEIPQVSAGEPLRKELGYFINCVRTGKRPLTDFQFGARITEQCETILAQIER